MRKQTKLVAVASAAALLAIGASMTSFAATGWVEEDGQWYFYDKDGNRVEDEWKKSGDNWYWLDSDEGGAMAVDKLIEDEDDTYYVDANGVMVHDNTFKNYGETAGDTFAYGDANDENERWYYADGDGNLAVGEIKKIKGKYYAFRPEGGAAGAMLNGLCLIETNPIDDAAFEEYLKDKSLSKNTIISYLYAIKQYDGMYDSITRKNLRDYKVFLIENYKPQTVNLRIRAINCYLESIRKEQWKIPSVKVQQKPFLENVISEADYLYFKNRLKADNEMYWYFVVRFLAATGARVSELVQIKSEHVKNMATALLPAESPDSLRNWRFVTDWTRQLYTRILSGTALRKAFWNGITISPCWPT